MSYIRTIEDYIDDDFDVSYILDWEMLMNCYKCIRREGISSKELETSIIEVDFKRSLSSINDILKWYKFKKINKND